MEITKIFSNVDYPQDRLYSVLMTEDEMALYQSMFSEEEEVEEPKKMGKGKKAAIATAAVAGTAGAAVGAYKGSKKVREIADAGAKQAREAGEAVVRATKRGAEATAGAARRGVDAVKETAQKGAEKAGEALGGVKARISDRVNRALANTTGRDAAGRFAKKTGKAGVMDKAISAVVKNPKATAAIAAGTAAATGAGVYGAKKLRDRKKNNK